MEPLCNQRDSGCHHILGDSRTNESICSPSSLYKNLFFSPRYAGAEASVITFIYLRLAEEVVLLGKKLREHEEAVSVEMEELRTSRRAAEQALEIERDQARQGLAHVQVLSTVTWIASAGAGAPGGADVVDWYGKLAIAW